MYREKDISNVGQDKQRELMRSHFFYYFHTPYYLIGTCLTKYPGGAGKARGDDEVSRDFGCNYRWNSRPISLLALGDGRELWGYWGFLGIIFSDLFFYLQRAGPEI